MVAGRETVFSKALNIGWREHPDPKPDTRYPDLAAITELDGFGPSPTHCSSMRQSLPSERYAANMNKSENRRMLP